MIILLSTALLLSVYLLLMPSQQQILFCAYTVRILRFRGLSQLTNTVKMVKKHLNSELEYEGILLTMFDARTNLSIQVAEEVKKFFGSQVFNAIIPRNVRLSEAPSHGLPIIAYDERSKGAEMYVQLAKEVIANEQKKAG